MAIANLTFDQIEELRRKAKNRGAGWPAAGNAVDQLADALHERNADCARLAGELASTKSTLDNARRGRMTRMGW